jgi:hypothetical protein
MPEGDIIGIVLPILPEHVSRVFNENRNVLVKYVSKIPRKPGKMRLQVGMKVVFYVSRSGRRLAGEGEISFVEFVSMQDAVAKYGGRLLLSESELNSYARQQPRRTEKPILALGLKKLRAYASGITYHKNISMVGEYLTRDANDALQQKGVYDFET